MLPARPLLTRRRRWRNRLRLRRTSSGRSVYNYFRDYDAVTGRYIQSDPIGLEGGINSYAYAASNPLGNVDPLGLFITSVDAACAIDPMFCTEIMGQMVRNAADLSGDPCRQQDAAELTTQLRVAGSLATMASVAGIVRAAGGSYSLVTHIPDVGRKLSQLAQRGWSRDSINRLVNSPFATRAATNRATGNPATAYFRSDGHYVVRDNLTGDLVQMSDTRLRVGTGAGQWRPDSSIVDPIIP